jgi:hypothetical protein
VVLIHKWHLLSPCPLQPTEILIDYLQVDELVNRTNMRRMLYSKESIVKFLHQGLPRPLSTQSPWWKSINRNNKMEQSHDEEHHKWNNISMAFKMANQICQWAKWVNEMYIITFMQWKRSAYEMLSTVDQSPPSLSPREAAENPTDLYIRVIIFKTLICCFYCYILVPLFWTPKRVPRTSNLPECLKYTKPTFGP